VHNPLRLFENVTIEDVAAAICEVTRIREICDRPPREAIAEFMGIMGVIPAFARPALEGGIIKVRVRDDYSDDDVALMTLVELVDVYEDDPLAREIVTRVLRRLGIIAPSPFPAVNP
jgi:hypothetical protein